MSQTFVYNSQILGTDGTKHSVNMHRVLKMYPNKTQPTHNRLVFIGGREEIVTMSPSAMTSDSGMVALTETTKVSVYVNFNNVEQFYTDRDTKNTRVVYVDGSFDHFTDSVASINSKLGIS